jgi:RNA polymerase sigma factor (sigma-70 family)
VRDSDDRRDRFRALYERHYPAVLRYAARRVPLDAASDVAAETFLIAWRRLDDVPPREPLPWLYATARRCLANEVRGQARSDRLSNRIRDDAGAWADSTPDGLAESVARRLDVLTALATLPAQAQEALRLTEWEQLDDAAAARVAGCSTTTFRVRLHRARRRLARALAQQQAQPADPADPADPARGTPARRQARAANVVPMPSRPSGTPLPPVAEATQGKESC